MQTNSFRKTVMGILLCLNSAAMASLDPELLSGLKARAIGPAAVGGRITAIDAVVSDPNRMIIGTATGGAWMTHNGGLTWAPVFDEQPVASIGAVAVNQNNPDIIWLGTGEGNTRNSTSIGAGLYKSVDGGKNWDLIGLENSERINRIALHPGNPDIAYVAALGTLWGPNQERGIYKTGDGGTTWERILFVDDTTGGTDIKMDPANPDKLIAAMWQFRRWPYRFESGGPGSGMYLSHDGGASWTQKTPEDGLPKGDLGRIAISFSASDPSRIYALVEAEKSALLRSDDGGENWTAVNEEYNVADRPFYYTEIIADPVNPDRVYNMATRLRVSIDGGKTFEYNPAIDCCAPGNTVHIDNHAFWINPNNPHHLVIGNDGGIAISQDRGDTWRFVRNLPLAQFYHVRVDNELPYNVYGGLQDNGSWRGPSEVWIPAGIRNLHWQEVGFGDGFDTVPDPANASAGYAMSQGGYLFRYNLDTGLNQMIRPAPQNAETPLRFNWNAGFALDPFEDGTIYYGSQYLHRSRDRGHTWSVISPDLTSNEPSLQRYRDSGGLTPDVTAAENYTSIVTVAPSELENGLIWVGTDDGRVHVTRDSGASWERVDERARNAPSGAWVPMITPSPHDAGTAFVVFDDHRRSNMNPYLYRVENFGQRWTRLEPEGLQGYVLSVLQDSVDPNLIFAGTEFGLFFSSDGGSSWTKFTAGVPTVSVMDMAIQQRETDLVLGTHGRSIFIIDDYSALRGLDDAALNQRLKILSATTGQHYNANLTSSTRFTGSGEFRGDNEPYGASITFIASGDDLTHPGRNSERARLARWRTENPDPSGKTDPVKVKVTVSNSSGDTIRTFREPVHQGINRITWNLRVDGVRPAPGPDMPKEDADLPSGPEVAPGDYRLTLSLENTSDNIDISTAADPRSGVTQAGLEAKFTREMALLELQETVVTALERIDRANKDIASVEKLMNKSAQLDEVTRQGLQDQAKALKQRLLDLEKDFRVPPETKGINFQEDKVSARLGTAQYYVGTSSGAPSPTAEHYVTDARNAVSEGVTALNAVLREDLTAFDNAVTAAGVGFFKDIVPVETP